MSVEERKEWYRAIKWLWLLLQALILPLALLYAVRAPVRWPLSLPAPLLFFTAALLLVLWLIANSLLSMARFPLTLKGGALLVGGTIAQYGFSVATGGSLTEALYAVFFANSAALALVVATMAIFATRRRQWSKPARLAGLLFLPPLAGLLWFLVTPLRQAFSRLTVWEEAFEWTLLALNSGLIVLSLYRFSIFAPPVENEAAYTAEWERWAAPTIIVLILSAASAIVLAGVFRRG